MINDISKTTYKFHSNSHHKLQMISIQESMKEVEEQCLKEEQYKP